MEFHEEWRDYLRGLADSFPNAAVVAAPVDPEDPAAADLEETSVLVFEVRIDHKHREITFHTEPDDDGAPFPLLPITIRRLMDQLEMGSAAEYDMLWVSGQTRMPAEEAPLHGDGMDARTYYVRQNGPIAGVAVSEADHRVVFLYLPHHEPESSAPGRPSSES